MKIALISLTISLGIILGRAAGFAREASIAARFGASNDADIAVLLLTVPDIFINLLMGGALSVALIPTFKRLGPGLRSHALFTQATLLTGAAFLIIAALASSLVSALVDVSAPGLNAESKIAAEVLLRQVLWVIPLTALAGVSTAYLHSNERFLIPALGTLIFNMVIVIAVLFFMDSSESLNTLVPAIIIAAFLRWTSQISNLPIKQFAIRMLRWPLLNRTLFKRYLQALGAGGLITLLPVIARALASETGEGQLALLNYSLKLVEFPQGIAISVLAIAIFPMLSQAHQKGEDSIPAIRTALRWVLTLSLAMAMVLYIFRETIAQLSFGWGKMTRDDVSIISMLFGLALISLPLQGVSSLLLAIFNSREDTRTPLNINSWATLAFLPLALAGEHYAGLPGVIAAMVFIFGIINSAQIFMLYRNHRIAIWEMLEPIRILKLNLFLFFSGSMLSTVKSVITTSDLGLLLIAIASGGIVLLSGLILMGEGKTLMRIINKRGSK